MEKAVKERFVKLIVKTPFFDKSDSMKLRKVGEELSVSAERAEKLISSGFAEKAGFGEEKAAAEK